jgi:hypothetical protein
MINNFLNWYIYIGTENEYLRSWFRSNRLEPPQTLLRMYSFIVTT